MKRIILNILAALAVVAGLILGAIGHGLLAVIVALALTWGGAVTLINQNTDWIWNE